MMEEEEVEEMDEEIERESGTAGLNPRSPKWKSRVQTNAPCCLKQIYQSATAPNAYDGTQCLRHAVAMKFQLVSNFNGHYTFKNLRTDSPSSLDEALASTENEIGGLTSVLSSPL